MNGLKDDAQADVGLRSEGAVDAEADLGRQAELSTGSSALTMCSSRPGGARFFGVESGVCSAREAGKAGETDETREPEDLAKLLLRGGSVKRKEEEEVKKRSRRLWKERLVTRTINVGGYGHGAGV